MIATEDPTIIMSMIIIMSLIIIVNMIILIITRKTEVRAIIATECSDQSPDQVVTYVFCLHHFNCHFILATPKSPKSPKTFTDLPKSPMTCKDHQGTEKKDLTNTNLSSQIRIFIESKMQHHISKVADPVSKFFCSLFLFLSLSVFGWLGIFLAVLACISPTQSDARGPTLAHPSLNCPLYFQPTNPSLPGALLCICEFVYLHICLVSSFVFAQHCSWRLKFALLERGPAICS